MAEQRATIAVVAIDMSAACAKAVTMVFPKAAQVIERFHFSTLVNKMVNGVRRTEHARLRMEGNEVLKGTSRIWLWAPENMSPTMLPALETVASLDLHTAKAWELSPVGGKREFCGILGATESSPRTEVF